MRVLSVVGARPQFVKLAPIAREFESRSIEHIVIHTGQHYDAAMSEDLFTDFALKDPDYNLGAGSGSHATQTADILAGIEPLLIETRPDWVVVYGDTNSTLGATLAAVKLGVPVAHLEAGLRSFNRSMPEEINRVMTDHAADLLLAPTATALRHLENEGLSDRTVLVGDVMADICLSVAAQGISGSESGLDLPGGDFILATLHRPYNTDDDQRLRGILGALDRSPVPVVLPVHPRLRHRLREADMTIGGGSLMPIAPLPYSDLIYAAQRSRAIVTDSGGLQKEAYLLGIPCVTVRSETEWTETLGGDWNRLCFTDLDAIVTAALRPIPDEVREDAFGQGDAARRVVDALCAQAQR